MNASRPNPTDARLDGRVALVTGSTRGIGEAIAKRFAAEGASVAVTGRSAEAGEAVASDINAGGGRALFVPADIAVEDDVRRAVEATEREFGALTTLVNNAAPTDLVGPAGIDGGVASVPTDDFTSIMSVALDGMLHCCRHAIPAFERAGQGCIVNISSAASIVGVPGAAAYTAAKGAMNALTRQMAVEYAPMNVRSNGLVVGFVLSSDMAALMAADEVIGAAMRAVQLTRLGLPEDVAAAAAFLASDDAEFITGALLAVDGGLTAKMNMPDVSGALTAQADSAPPESPAPASSG